MPKIKSSQKAFFINIGTDASPTWAKLGKGVNALDQAYNPQVTTETYIDVDNAESSIDSYQASTGLTVTRWDSENAPAHEYLDELRRTRAVGEDAESEILEVDLNTSSPYTAQKHDAVVAINNLKLAGGKPQELGTTIYYNGAPVDGTVVITDGVPVFTPDSVDALSLDTIVPADGGAAIAVGSSIVLTFNNKIKGESIVLTTAAGVAVAVTRSWDAAHKVLTLAPDIALTAGTTYLVIVSGVVDIYGQVLAAAVKDFETAA